MNLKQLSKEELQETSFIEIAYAILTESKQPMAFQEILSQIQKYQELSDAELKSRMIQFYTDLNVDGRFITFGENRWGLRAWYPVDQLEEEVTPAVKAKKKKTKKAVKEEPEFEEEDEVEDLEDDLDFEEDDLDELEEDDEDDLDELAGLDDKDDEDEDEDFDEELVDEDEYDLDDEDEEDLK